VAPPEKNIHFMAIAATLIHHLRDNLIQNSLLPMRARVGRTSAPRIPPAYIAKSDGFIFAIAIERQIRENEWRVQVNDVRYEVITPPMEYYRRRLKLVINDQPHHFRLRYSGNFIETAFCGNIQTFEIYTPKEWQLAQFMPKPVPKATDNLLRCPMPGLIVEIKTQPGVRVFKGQELLTIESMKMETSVASPVDGEVAEIGVAPGDAVDTGTVLLSFK